MEDCEKFKKRFYAGLILILVVSMFEAIKGFTDILILDFIIVMLLGSYSINLMMPHLRCLSQFKRSIK